MPLRAAVALLIGAGAGCDDDTGEESDAASAEIAALANAYVERVGIQALQDAALLVHGDKLRGSK